MKYLLLMLIAYGSFFCSTVYAQDPDKMTYEKALKSHKNTFDKYQNQSITAAESQQSWDSYQQEPEKSDSGSGGHKLEEVWKGFSKAVDVTWGQGDYYIEMNFNKKNTGGSIWLTVDNSSLMKSVAVPSPFNYEANWHIQYSNNTFNAMGLGKGSTSPFITRISKFPTPQLDECVYPKIEKRDIFCGTGRTCEVGLLQRACATNGGWLPYETIFNPVCVSQNQSCP